jgi:hypothetical protein
MDKLMYVDKNIKYTLKLNNLKGGIVKQLQFYNYSSDKIIQLNTNKIIGKIGLQSKFISNKIHEIYMNNTKTLGIKNIESTTSINNENIPCIVSKSTNFNYHIIPYNINNNEEPAFGYGGATAIYKLKNATFDDDKKIYILRLFFRRYSKWKHMMDRTKITTECKLFHKYLIEILHYGTTNIDGLELDYIITKEYFTPIYNVNRQIVNMTNVEKYIFLYNNVKMLAELKKKNMFHADYQISNIGWNNSVDVVLIDYDLDTIQEVSSENALLEKKNIDGSIYITKFNKNFIPTHIPIYIAKYADIINGKLVTKPDTLLPLSYFNKFSIGGLAHIINELNIETTSDVCKIPSSISTTITEIKIDNND